MTARVEFFFDLSSPWTCLAFHNLPGVLERTGASATWRPILVGGVLILLYIYWHASVKNWFTGPIRQVDASGEELEGVS